MSALAALFSAFPKTSWSQNVGLVNLNGDANLHVTAIGGIILMLLGVVAKVGALLATIPAAAIGGGGLIRFAMIFSSGLAIIHRRVALDRRNLVILAIAVALGLGVELRPEALQHFPNGLRTVSGCGLIAGGLAALVLDLAPPGRAAVEPLG